MSGTEADSTPWAPSLSVQVLGAKPRPGIPAAHPTQTRGLVTQIPSRGPGPGQRGPPSTKLRVQTARRWTVTSLFSETKRDTESTREGSRGGGHLQSPGGISSVWGPPRPQVRTRPACSPKAVICLLLTLTHGSGQSAGPGLSARLK